MKSAAATTITCVEPALTMAMWQYSTSKYVARTSDPWGNRLRFVGDRSAHINRHEAALTSKRLDSFVLHGKCSGCCCCLGNPHRAAWAHICFCPRLGFRQRRRRVYIRTTCNFAFINFNFLLFFCCGCIQFYQFYRLRNQHKPSSVALTMSPALLVCSCCSVSTWCV